MALVPFDDRDGMIWWNGHLRPWRDAKLHVLSHGLHYGSAVFEGERAYSGNIFKLREHSERLKRSAQLLGYEIPYSVEEIDEACKQVLAANGLTDAYVRPIAWRGSEQLAVSAKLTSINLAIAVWAWPNLFGADRMKGVRLGFAEWKRPHPETAPTASKAAGLYMIGTMSKHKAEDNGFDDALMLDWRGQVSEATGANIFFVMDGELHTPTPDCFLDGITRLPEEIKTASEVFLAGTAAEVTPVRQIGELTFTPGPITERLLRDYEALVQMSPEQVAALAA
jgi:branched-chain amino acid aminotransferase